jgi:tetratricopeptide (TPR) repeat protein
MDRVFVKNSGKYRIISYFMFFFLCITKIAGTAEVSEGDTVFARKNYAAALELYSQARQNQKDNNWKRFTVQIIRCCLAQGDTERAVQEYFLLCRVDPAPPLEWIPLPWFVPIETAMGVGLREKTAENWLDPLQNPSQTKSLHLAAKLLAAGTLSVSPDRAKQQRGNQLLRDLEMILETSKKTPDIQEFAFQRHIALLATALRWKQRIPTLRSPSELTLLRRILEQIPESYQAGPLFLFGRAAQQVGDHETAVLSWLRIPILYSENTPLAVEALRESALSLEKLGRFGQAEQLQTERSRLEINMGRQQTGQSH